MELTRFYRRGDRLWWLCPGCDNWHGVPTAPDKVDGHWKQTGTDDTPTLSPSLRVQHGQDGPICHFFVRNGSIDFCSDSDHELAGQKAVPVQETPHFLWNEGDEELPE